MREGRLDDSSFLKTLVSSARGEGTRGLYGYSSGYPVPSKLVLTVAGGAGEGLADALQDVYKQSCGRVIRQLFECDYKVVATVSERGIAGEFLAPLAQCLCSLLNQVCCFEIF